MSAERKYFRRRKTNWLLAFHLFDGLALLALSFNFASLLRLNTFGLPSRSVCMPRHPYSGKLRVNVYASETRRARHTKFFLFVDKHAHPPREALTAHALNLHVPERFRKAVTVRDNLSGKSISEKNQSIKVSRIQRVKEVLRFQGSLAKTEDKPVAGIPPERRHGVAGIEPQPRRNRGRTRSGRRHGR